MAMYLYSAKESTSRTESTSNNVNAVSNSTLTIPQQTAHTRKNQYVPDAAKLANTIVMKILSNVTTVKNIQIPARHNNTNHQANNTNCPLYANQKDRIIKRTDYGL